MKSRQFFSSFYALVFSVACGRPEVCPSKTQQEHEKIMEIVSSDSSKKISGDTRNNWVTMLFITKKRYRCFRKQSYIETCKKRFEELESLGFEFGEFGFAGNHVHFQVNIPKKYSIEDTEIILKSETSKRMFLCHPGFRRRYLKGAFLEWL